MCVIMLLHESLRLVESNLLFVIKFHGWLQLVQLPVQHQDDLRLIWEVDFLSFIKLYKFPKSVDVNALPIMMDPNPKSALDNGQDLLAQPRPSHLAFLATVWNLNLQNVQNRLFSKNDSSNPRQLQNTCCDPEESPCSLSKTASCDTEHNKTDERSRTAVIVSERIAIANVLPVHFWNWGLLLGTVKVGDWDSGYNLVQSLGFMLLSSSSLL